MYARIYDLKADKSKLLLQIGEYRMALEKILRLKDATPSTALDAVWIAKDALLGTNHMEKPLFDPTEDCGCLVVGVHRQDCPMFIEKREHVHRFNTIESNPKNCLDCGQKVR